MTAVNVQLRSCAMRETCICVIEGCISGERQHRLLQLAVVLPALELIESAHRMGSVEMTCLRPNRQELAIGVIGRVAGRALVFTRH